MSKAVLPPWEVIPPWEKRVPTPAATPVVQKVRFAQLENTFIPPLPPPPPEPVSAPPPQRPSSAHRRTISLPRNPRPVRPKIVPNSPRPIDIPPQSTSESSPITTSDAIPPPLPEGTQAARPRSRSSTLPGTLASSPSSASSTAGPPLPLNTSYPSPPASNKSPISPKKQLENITEDNNIPVNKSLPPAPQPDILPANTASSTPRTSRFNALKRSLSLKILPQNSNGRRSPSTLSATPHSPTPPTPDIPPNWSNTIGPSRPLTIRNKNSKRLASPNYNEEMFALVETASSRVVTVADSEKEAAEYIARSPRTPKTSTLPSPRSAMKSSKSLHVRQRSRRLASPGYIQEKYSIIQGGGSGDRDIMGEAIVSGGRSPGIRDEDIKKSAGPVSDGIEDQANNGNPDSSTFDISDIYDQKTAQPPSPKPEPPPKEPSAGPRLIPLKYAAVSSPKELPQAGPTAPKLIPLKFLSPPSPEESGDESYSFSHESIEDFVSTPIEVAPLRIRSSQNTPTSIQDPENNSDLADRAPSSLTSHLISRATPRKLYNATHSIFLRSCSNGEISFPLLSRYLTQERVFLQTYLRFLALLLANITIPPKRTSRPSSKPETLNLSKGINARLTSHLITQLSHAQAQLSLFSSLVADLPALDLESWEESEDGMTDATRMLVRLFDVIGSAVERGEKSVLVAVVVSWVREKAHHEAWKEVKSTISTRSYLSNQTELETEASKVVAGYLLPVWTGVEVISSMENLTKLLDDLWSDKYLNGSKSFVERGEGMKQSKQSPMKNRERGWDADAGELEEMMEMVLGIVGRGWVEGSN